MEKLQTMVACGLRSELPWFSILVVVRSRTATCATNAIKMLVALISAAAGNSSWKE